MIPTYQNELPETVRVNDNLFFHGSSNISEQALETGYIANFSFLTREILKTIINTHDSINWKGIHTSGYAVLSSFSMIDWSGSVGKKYLPIRKV
jgi:hypothetical protein